MDRVLGMKTENNILIAFILNVAFSLFEGIGGLFTGSIAILSDSLHDLGDAISIGLSYFLEKKSKKKPDNNYTYGYTRYSVMGSIITTMILLVGSVLVIIGAIKRLINPVAINYNGMIIIAILGTVINLAATYFTRGGDSLNQKAVNLHMLEDVLGWIVVLIGSILMKFTNITLIDPVLSILVAIFIFYHAWKNWQEVMDLFLEKTPKNINIDTLKKHLLKIDNLYDVHHIHVRSIDGINNFATLHAVVKNYSKEVKDEIKKELAKLGIKHSTIELELQNEKCESLDCHLEKKEPSAHHH